MKKLFTLFFLIIISVFAARAEEPSMTIIENGIFYGGFMPLDISGDGRLVCGSTYVGAVFISDWQKQDTRTPGTSLENQTMVGGELRSITNSGLAVGFGMTVDFETEKIGRLRLADMSQNVKGGLVDAVTEDGRIFCGLAYIQDDPRYYAAYWEDEECHLLPTPTADETGWPIYGSRARFISDDGNIIAGYMVDRLSTFPFIYWTRKDDGSYEMHPVFQDYFCDIRDNDKTYVRFCPYAMSPNGRWVVLLTKYSDPTGVFSTNSTIALYDIPTGKITPVPVDGNHNIPVDAFLQVWDHGVANDGTIVGWFEHLKGRSPFIVYPDELQPRLLADVFDTFGPLADYEDIGDNAVSCITPDGRYIAGCAWTISRQYDIGFYEGYVIDTGRSAMDEGGSAEDSGVAAIAAEGEPAYFDIAGHRLARPLEKGITIVRRPDGSSSKIFAK